MRARYCAALLAVIAGLGSGVSAQGLADAARRASAAPQQPATKKYTNDDVETVKPVALPAAAAAQGQPAAEPPKSDTAKAADAAAPAAEEVKATETEPKKTPEHVLNRIAQLKARLQNKEKQLRDLQARDAASDAAVVANQIAKDQEELKILEARVSGRD